MSHDIARDVMLERRWVGKKGRPIRRRPGHRSLEEYLREDDVQRAVFEHYRLRRAPATMLFHVPNGGFRSKAEAAILKGLGVTPGVPDIVGVRLGHFYGLEVKPEKGSLKGAQGPMLKTLGGCGGTIGVGYGLDQCIAYLEQWGFLRGRVV